MPRYKISTYTVLILLVTAISSYTRNCYILLIFPSATVVLCLQSGSCCVQLPQQHLQHRRSQMLPGICVRRSLLIRSNLQFPHQVVVHLQVGADLQVHILSVGSMLALQGWFPLQLSAHQVIHSILFTYCAYPSLSHVSLASCDSVGFCCQTTCTSSLQHSSPTGPPGLSPGEQTFYSLGDSSFLFFR